MGFIIFLKFYESGGEGVQIFFISDSKIFFSFYILRKYKSGSLFLKISPSSEINFRRR